MNGNFFLVFILWDCIIIKFVSWGGRQRRDSSLLKGVHTPFCSFPQALDGSQVTGTPCGTGMHDLAALSCCSITA